MTNDQLKYALSLSTDQSDRPYRLIEITEELALEKRQVYDLSNPRLWIRGLPDNEAVLCSAAKSYKIKSHHTSNTLLVARAVEGRMNAVDSSAMLYELSENKFSPQSLRDCLKPSEYVGPGHEDRFVGPKKDCRYSLGQLREIIQLSDQELLKALNELNALSIDGKIRLLHDEYVAKGLEMIIAICSANGWSLHSFPLRTFFSEFDNSYFDEYPATILA